MGFATVVLLTLAMGAVAFSALQQVVQSKDLVITRTAQGLIDAQSMRAAMQQKVADARGLILSDNQRFKEALQSAARDFGGALERIEGRAPSPEELILLQQIRSAATAYDEELERVLVRQGDEGPESVVARFDARLVPRFNELSEAVLAYVSLQKADLVSKKAASTAAANQATFLVLLIAIAAALLAALLAVVLTRSLTRQIGASIQQVRSSSAELQAAASQQASGAKEQATAMTEITTTISELLTTSRQIAQSAQRVARIAGDTAGGARTGNDSVRNAEEAVSSIRDQVDTIVSYMLELGRKSQQIGGILEIINELAEQTNILAINATIEAAGAGEAGRRFAVVGEEIRKLADRVGGSTKEIRTLIEEVRFAVNATVMATETGSKTVDVGQERFAELSSSFDSIGKLVETTTEAAREIELSTKQQATAVEQVNVAISNVAQATKESEASSGQTLQTASQLAGLSNELARLVQAE